MSTGVGWVQSGDLFGLGQFFVAGAEDSSLVVMFAYSGSEEVVGDRSGLEGEHVAIDGRLGLFSLVPMVAISSWWRRTELAASCPSAALLDQPGVGVNGEERVEYGLLKHVGPDAFTDASILAVALAGEADVVARAVAFARRGDAHVVAVAVAADDQPQEQVLGLGVGHATVAALASFGQEGVCLVDKHRVDEGLLGLVAHVAKGRLALIASGPQDVEDHLRGRAPPATGVVSLVAEPGGDGGCLGLLSAVVGEDAFDQVELGGLDGQVVLVELLGCTYRCLFGARSGIVTDQPGPLLDPLSRPSHAVEVHDESRPMTQVGGLLLTGGRSRRMGFDKASISIDGVPSAQRTAETLRKVVFPIIEVGPDLSGLMAICEEPRGSGPLVAISAGFQALRRIGHDGPAIVLACDLPLVTDAALRMLAGWPGDCSVVPVVAGWPQPLCARWSAADLASVAGLVDAGERSMKALLARPGLVRLDEWSWPAEVTASAFADVDTPADLDRLGLSWQPDAANVGRIEP
jgi:molybdopterin-guanine dinucleotide biosynthesis protein A